MAKVDLIFVESPTEFLDLLPIYFKEKLAWYRNYFDLHIQQTDRQTNTHYLLLVFPLRFEARVHVTARLQERSTLRTLRRVMRKYTRDIDAHEDPTV